MEFHEAANIFPLDEEHLGDLAADIREHGQQVPIEVTEGRILDGRRRYMACRKAGVEPQYREVRPDDPVAYVLSLNLHRRHLTPSQATMVGARARDWYDKNAKDRQHAGQQRGGKTAGRGRPKDTDSLGANLPPSYSADAGRARDQVAAAVGVGGRTIDYGTRVLKHGVPELVRAVDEGHIKVSAAAELAKESPETQRAAVERARRRGTVSARSLREQDQGPTGGNGTPRIYGVGIIHAQEAVDRLKLIPLDDHHRERGFQIVRDWMRRHR